MKLAKKLKKPFSYIKMCKKIKFSYNYYNKHIIKLLMKILNKIKKIKFKFSKKILINHHLKYKIKKIILKMMKK